MNSIGGRIFLSASLFVNLLVIAGLVGLPLQQRQTINLDSLWKSATIRLINATSCSLLEYGNCGGVVDCSELVCDTFNKFQLAYTTVTFYRTHSISCDISSPGWFSFLWSHSEYKGSFIVAFISLWFQILVIVGPWQRWKRNAVFILMVMGKLLMVTSGILIISGLQDTQSPGPVIITGGSLLAILATEAIGIFIMRKQIISSSLLV
jgi:hypothetical protein